MIVLDASILIAHLDDRDAHHERAGELLATTEGEALGATTITLAETLAAPARANRLREATGALQRLGVRQLELGADAPSRLAELRASTALKLPDCCVLLAAQEHGGRLATFDEALRRRAAKSGIGVL